MKKLEFGKKRRAFDVLLVVCFFVICFIFSWFLEPPMVFADKTEIRYMTFVDPNKDDPRSLDLKKKIGDFEKKYPQYKVIVDVVPWAEIDKIMISAAASGKGLDVVRTSGLRIGIQVEAGAIIPLNRFCANWTQGEKNDFIMPWDTEVWNGKKMGFPLEFRTAVLYYNEDYLRKAGFEKPPQTINELIKITSAMRKIIPDVAPFGIGLSAKRHASAFVEVAAPLVWSAGGEVLDSQGRASFNSPAGVKAFQFIRDLVKVHAVMPKSVIGYTYDELHTALQSRTIAMGLLGSQRYVAIRAGMKPEFQKYFKTAPIPGFDGPAPAMPFGWKLTISSASKNPEAAWKFLEHMVSPEAQFTIGRIAGELPARKSAYKDPWFSTQEAAHMEIWKDYIAKHGKIFQIPVHFSEMGEFLAEAAQKTILMDTDIKKALDEAATKYNALLGK